MARRQTVHLDWFESAIKKHSDPHGVGIFLVPVTGLD